MSRGGRKRNNNKGVSTAKIDEFPEDFCGAFFHYETVSHDRRIGNLRHMVYKRIKKEIIDRVESYSEAGVSDKFDIVFERGVYTDFQWGVIREELLDCEFDAVFEFEKEESGENESSTEKEESNRILRMVVHVERSVDLHETLEDRQRDEDDDEYSDSESDCESQSETKKSGEKGDASSTCDDKECDVCAHPDTTDL